MAAVPGEQEPLHSSTLVQPPAGAIRLSAGVTAAEDRRLDSGDEGSLRAQPDRLAPHRQRARRGREPRLRRHDAAADRRHRPGPQPPRRRGRRSSTTSRWLGIDWDEGPVRQSERQERYREAAAGLPGPLPGRDAAARGRHARPTTSRASSTTSTSRSPTSSAATTTGPTRSSTARSRLALGGRAARVHPLRARARTRTARRSRSAPRAPRSPRCASEGIPAEAVRAYLEELGIPRHDVHLDLGADPLARGRA